MRYPTTLPVRFAQVREDACIDGHVVHTYCPDNANIALVGSGGCTAAYLAALPKIQSLHIVDPNPSQIAMCRLKMHLSHTHSLSQRLCLLGHKKMPAAERKKQLQDIFTKLHIPEEALGPLSYVAEVGPDYVGRYEWLFKALREHLSPFRKAILELFLLDDIQEQHKRVAPHTALGKAIDDAFDKVMALDQLVRLFGEEATRSPLQPFSRHFVERLRLFLATQKASTSPYLAQLLLGTFYHNTYHPWFKVKSNLVNVTYSINTMQHALDTIPPNTFDLIHLSNITDWLSTQEIENLLQKCTRALKKEGVVLVRRLNSIHDVDTVKSDFSWIAATAALLQQDRSFFYRRLYIGRKV